ncbi:hypothetical protein TNCV_5031291 [Trichonephila clavipes]|nr:hypothetical protein TNCV_5031291 [Trichonephila clavipes]
MIFLWNYKNCSKERPPAKMHASHRWQRNCRTLANTLGISRISPARTVIFATRASSESTGLALPRLFIRPQRKKSRQERSDEGAANLPDQPVQSIALDMLYPIHF